MNDKRKRNSSAGANRSYGPKGKAFFGDSQHHAPVPGLQLDIDQLIEFYTLKLWIHRFIHRYSSTYLSVAVGTSMPGAGKKLLLAFSLQGLSGKTRGQTIERPTHPGRVYSVP